ncbi:hypothetical protein PMAN_a1225 [Pseudoalteromonas marina]|uniref:hypothetical protein n=1 Tax=Pseudoalteromonas marina TaxID=267375 RepID=UPI00026CE9D5|nr:hypothetical protein [Pseudoalteromonas marina]KAF7780227.1 hypothetical protein PMAN_a1225 [Pseudoalteromonas marina]
MEIKEYTAIIAIGLSSISFVFSLFTFMSSRKDKKDEQRKEIFNLIIEASLTCKSAKSSLIKLERQLSLHFPEEEVGFTTETQLIENLELGINDAITQIKEEKKPSEEIYFLSKQLVASIDNMHKSVQDKIAKYDAG